jgi:hypothetical protein
MELNAHSIEHIIIETPVNRQHTPQSDKYQHMNITLVDEKGIETEVSLFSREGKFTIHHVDDGRETLREIRQARQENIKQLKKDAETAQKEADRLARQLKRTIEQAGKKA